MTLPAWAWWAFGVAACAAAFVAGLPWLIRPLIRAVLGLRYSFEVLGGEHVPTSGPALLAANHVTWLDGFFVVAATSRRGYALANAAYLAFPVLRWLARRAGIIPVPASGPHGQRAAIAAAQQALDRGEAVLIFPEAQMTRNGLTGQFYRGIEVILKHREHVPVIPVFLDNLWGSVFSFYGGRFFAQRPRGLRRTVVVVFGPPVTPPVMTFSVRQAMLAASARGRARLTWLTAAAAATVDPNLPHWTHPQLGQLAVSSADYDRDGIRQVGQKPGTVGQAAPGVALRAVDGRGQPLGPDAEGALQAIVPAHADWGDTGWRGRIDRDGFVTLEGNRD
jgi:1-acyl-sn-glycerol-3-phosphate acyltransferase